MYFKRNLKGGLRLLFDFQKHGRGGASHVLELKPDFADFNGFPVGELNGFLDHRVRIQDHRAYPRTTRVQPFGLDKGHITKDPYVREGMV